MSHITSQVNHNVNPVQQYAHKQARHINQSDKSTVKNPILALIAAASIQKLLESQYTKILFFFVD